MVHDLLFAKSGRINCGKSKTKDSILTHKTRLKAELVKYKLKHGIKETSEMEDSSLKQDSTPVRWVRTNTIKASDGEIRKAFEGRGLKVVDSWTLVQNDKQALYIDENVPYLYGLNPQFPLTLMDIYQQGKVIIQDRASCFPATILAPKPGDMLIDACSAPGNKTTHLAAFVNNTRDTIRAFERDTKRAGILKKMIGRAGATNSISVTVGDFTESDPNDFPLVTGFIVDPSCSGSGIFGRGFDEQEQEKGQTSQEDRFRLIKLAEFQYKIVRHAMSFPNARKLVYSTCSIHAEENEQVVKRLLQDPDVEARGWKLTEPGKVLPNWKGRGLVEEFAGMENPEALAASCVRAKPIEDGGIGFFAACFERDGSKDGNPEDKERHGPVLEEKDSESESEYSDWGGLQEK